MMYENCLDAVKGWFYLSALDKSAPMSLAMLSSVTNIPAGRVAHLNGSAQFDLGGSGHQMPIFLWNGNNDADVQNNGVSPTSGATNWIAIAPVGNAMGLVATGGYELQTTEFDTSLQYQCNDLLTTLPDGNGNYTGILTNAGAVAYAQGNSTNGSGWICGVCSSFVNGDNQSVGLGVVPAPVGAVGINAYGVKVLTFWSYFLPAHP
jgi:hypothetical protein